MHPCAGSEIWACFEYTAQYLHARVAAAIDFAYSRSLNECMRDDKFRFTHQLQPGELVIFNNRRVMHGRTAYDPTSVSRSACLLSFVSCC